MATQPKALTLAQYQALLTGIPIDCASNTFIVAGNSYNATQASALVQSVLNSILAVPAARVAWEAAHKAEVQSLATDGQTVKEYPREHGADVQQRAKHAPRPRHCAEEGAQALVRGGPCGRQRKGKGHEDCSRDDRQEGEGRDSSGNVTGVNITPVTTPEAAPAVTPSATPAVAPAPAAGASAAKG